MDKAERQRRFEILKEGIPEGIEMLRRDMRQTTRNLKKLKARLKQGKNQKGTAAR